MAAIETTRGQCRGSYERPEEWSKLAWLPPSPSQQRIRTRDLVTSPFFSPTLDLVVVSAEKWELLSLRRKETGKVLTAERLWKGAYLEEHLKPAPGISASTNEARVPGVTSQHQ